MLSSDKFPLALLACLIALQGADLALTWRLLAGGSTGFYEANALADAVLSNYGWAGVFCLKAGSTVAAVAAVLLLWRFRPAVASRVLLVLCLLVAAVVGYSGFLLVRGPDSTVTLPRLADLQERERSLDDSNAAVARFNQRRLEICLNTLRGRTEVVTAVREMTQCLREGSPHLHASIRNRLPAADRPEQVAAYLHLSCAKLVSFGFAEPAQLEALSENVLLRYPDARLIAAREAGVEAEPHPALAG